MSVVHRAVLVLSVGFLLAVPAAEAGPRVSVGLNFGFPVYPHHHCWHDHIYYYGYRPYYPPPVVIERPVVVQPRPVVIEQAPVYVQPAAAAPQAGYTNTYSEPPVAQPQYTEPGRLASVSAPQTWSGSLPAPPAPPAETDRYLQMLTNPDEQVRSDAVMQLGRMKAARAVDPIAATLAGDRSPLVRESAARALGLIADPRSLTALNYAAQADNDRDVRRSAQFAVEVIQTNNRR